jgi:hypothetical protein
MCSGIISFKKVTTLMFIEFTTGTKKVAVNPEHITSVHPVDDGTAIMFVGGRQVDVRVSYDNVIAQLRAAECSK